MKPKLASLLSLENPFEEFLNHTPELATERGERNLKISERAYNRALEDVLAAMNRKGLVLGAPVFSGCNASIQLCSVRITSLGAACV